jgi:7-cyano-7-deazaguanine synthase in queuosine biosynthesis
MKNCDTLLHFSGGQDSTYALYSYLRDNPKKHLLVHHVNLNHKAEDRVNQEAAACKKIMRWLRANGYGNFTYLESSFSYGDLPRISIKDIQVVAMFTGIILRTTEYKHIKKVILSWHRGEVNAPEIGRGYRVKKVLKGLDVEEDRYELLFPIEHLTRQDMAEDMPSTLLGLCHCCRKPVGNKSCGRCKPCKELIAAGIFNKVNSL